MYIVCIVNNFHGKKWDILKVWVLIYKQTNPLLLTIFSHNISLPCLNEFKFQGLWQSLVTILT